MPGPLHNIKVVDFTEVIGGPLAGRLLAEMGADVIKIEPPWGDPWRKTTTITPTESRSFMVYNRGKRSLSLDLTKPEAKELLQRLVPDMDVALVNYRPDVAAKLGVDYETLSKLNSRLIYCELTAYGREGPDSHRPGYDIILQAMSGMIAAEHKTIDGLPQWVWSTPVIDCYGGMCLAWCVCAALFAWERTGRGQKVETSLLGSAMALMGPRLLQVESRDKERRGKVLEEINAKRAALSPFDELVAISPGSRRLVHHINAYYRIYMTQDGPIGVGCLSDPLRRRLLDALGFADVSLDPGYASDSSEAEAYAQSIIERAEAMFQQKSSAEWLALFEERGIPAAPVRFIEELFDDSQVQANGLVVEVEHKELGTVKTMGPQAKFSNTPLPTASASPALGQHTVEVLQELGYSEVEISRWLDLGIVR